MNWLTVLIVLALLATALALLLGLVTMQKGGSFDRRYGNKLMWARVGMQALAVLLLVLVWFAHR